MFSKDPLFDNCSGFLLFMKGCVFGNTENYSKLNAAVYGFMPCVDLSDNRPKNLVRDFVQEKQAKILGKKLIFNEIKDFA